MVKILSDNTTNKIGQVAGKGFSFATKNKFLARTLETAVHSPFKYANAMVIASIVSKDFVNCYYYTTQSLHNKRIPEEKRKFVASLDLMNGFIMVFGQIIAGILFEKVMQKKLFNKVIAKKLDNDILGIHAKKALEMAKAAGKNFDIKDMSKTLIDEYGSNSSKFKAMKGGFGLIISFFATTALTKRTIAPLLSTPLAGWFKGKYMDKPKAGANKAEPKSDAKSDKKPKQTPNLDDKLLDHSTAPWNYSNQSGDKATFKKMLTK